MSVIPQFNCLTRNEIARKAIESYSEILQKAFECYQNLWEDYIKLQEKCEQRNVDSSSQMIVNTPCIKRKDGITLDDDKQEGIGLPLLELDRINTSSVNLNFDIGTDSSDAGETMRKSTKENDSPESPVFSRAYSRSNNNSARKFKRSPKAVRKNLTFNMKISENPEKDSSKHNNKPQISTTHHVETTFLPTGRRLKQSRLAFHQVRNNEKIFSSPSKHKADNASHNVKQNFVYDVSNTVATATENASNSNEILEDVIEISPTQKIVTSKVKKCLTFKRKVSEKRTKGSPCKSNSSVTLRTTDDIDFGLCPSSVHTTRQMEDDKVLTDTTVDKLQDKANISYLSVMHNKSNIQKKKVAGIEDLSLIQKMEKDKIIQDINDTAYDETFYSPAEQAANKDDFKLDDIENKPPKRKKLDEFTILSKGNVPEQLNMRRKADRAKLDGWDCWECKKYYKNLSLSKEELQKRKNQCSRHRLRYERPNTPEGFWNPEFPETLSCTYRQDKN